MVGASFLVGAPATAGGSYYRWSFDTPTRAGYRDSGGRGVVLAARGAAGGRLAAVTRPPGRAVGYPLTGRAILEAAHRGALNPGARPIQWGARVWLPGSRAGGGQNVIQKGYANRGGQYKLQVDGAAGRPSCAVVGTGAGRIHLARAARSVADGRWHDVWCSRYGASLSVVVDGAVSGRVTVPRGLALRPGGPLRLGGKHVLSGNDQFRGAVDDAWITLR